MSGISHDPAVEHAEAGDAGGLVGTGEQQLHADADAEERRARVDAFERDLVESGRAQRVHARPEGTDAGEHHAVGVVDEARDRR